MCHDAVERSRLRVLGLWEGSVFRFTRRLSYAWFQRFLTQRCRYSATPWPQRPEQQVILAPTHASHLDFWSICLALPPGIRRKLYIAAATDHFYARWGWGLATRLLSYHNFAFNRHAQGTTEFKRLLRILQAGYSLLLFPQGSRMREGKWAPFKPWVARLAIASGVPVLSVGLAGTDRALPPGARWPRTAAIRVEFGPALPPPLAAQGQWGEVVRREALDRYAGAINQNAYELWQRAQEKIPA